MLRTKVADKMAEHERVGAEGDKCSMEIFLKDPPRNSKEYIDLDYGRNLSKYKQHFLMKEYQVLRKRYVEAAEKSRALMCGKRKISELPADDFDDYIESLDQDIVDRLHHRGVIAIVGEELERRWIFVHTAVFEKSFWKNKKCFDDLVKRGIIKELII